MSAKCRRCVKLEWYRVRIDEHDERVSKNPSAPVSFTTESIYLAMHQGWRKTRSQVCLCEGEAIPWKL